MQSLKPSFLSLCILSILSTSAFADTSITPVVLDPVVITVESQIKQSLGASIISQSDLERTPIKSDIAQIVRKMPGVNLTGNSATGQRGNNRQIDIRGMGPENTLILIDGKPTTSRQSVRYGWRGERDTRGDSQWVPSNLIEKIEVLRGPSASRYGNGAMGGVVNIITKKISDNPSGSVEIYTEKPHNDKEGDSRRISVNFSGSIIPQKLGFLVYGNLNKTDMDAVDINPLVPYKNANGQSYLTRAAGREGVENKDVGLRLNYQINPSHHLRFDATYGRQGNQYTGDTQYSNRDSSATTTSAQSVSNAHLNSLIGSETNIMKKSSHALTHEGEYSWGDSKVTLQYDQTKNTRLNEGLAGGPEGVISHTLPHFEDTKLNTVRTHGEIVMPLSFTLPQTLTLGAEYVKDTLHELANMEEGTSSGTDPNATYANTLYQGDRSKLISKVASIYAENNINIKDNTNFAITLRYDHHNHSGSNLSPAFNLTHHLNERWTVKAGIAKAYKIPNLYQNSPAYMLGTRGQGCPWRAQVSGWCVLQGNANLKPETAVNSELGFLYRNQGVNASLTYFHSDYKDKIAASDAIREVIEAPYGQGTTKYNVLDWINIPKAVVEGLEGSINYVNNGLHLNNNLTYMIKSKDKHTGNPLSLVPTYTWNTTLGYDLNDRWDINATYTHYGRQKARQFAESNIENVSKDGLLHNQNMKGYGIFSVNTGYQFNDSLSGRLGVNNLFDKQKLRDNTIGQTYNEAGRSYFASLKYDF